VEEPISKHNNNKKRKIKTCVSSFKFICWLGLRDNDDDFEGINFLIGF
jgi:hypothetical protein